MRNAEAGLNIIREASRKRSLESHVIRKSVTRGSEEGRWKSVYQGNSLAAYPTARCVRRGGHVLAHEVSRSLPYHLRQ